MFGGTRLGLFRRRLKRRAVKPWALGFDGPTGTEDVKNIYLLKIIVSGPIVWYDKGVFFMRGHALWPRKTK